MATVEGWPIVLTGGCASPLKVAARWRQQASEQQVAPAAWPRRDQAEESSQSNSHPLEEWAEQVAVNQCGWNLRQNRFITHEALGAPPDWQQVVSLDVLLLTQLTAPRGPISGTGSEAATSGRQPHSGGPPRGS